MSDEELAKDLGLLSAMTIGIGTMIGAGIFVLPGTAAATAGPIVVLSFIIGGMIAVINALTVSELGTAMPKAGGAYYYINRALGPLFGSVAGMGDWIGLAFASAFYSIGFGSYLATLLEGTTLSLPVVGAVELLPTIVLGPLVLTDIQVGALIAGIVFVGVNYIGAKETGGVQSVIVLTLLGILTVFAFVGFFSFDWGTVVVDGSVAPLGYGELLPGAALVFVSYLGYAKIATVGEELKNPGRNLPIAIVGSVLIVMVIYSILVGLMVGIIPYDQIDQEAPMTDAATVVFDVSVALGGSTFGLAAAGITMITLAALLATASSANASILASARINFAMGRDKIVTDWLNEIHPNFATPYRSIFVTGFMIVTFITLLGSDVEVLAKAASVLHLVVYALTNVALIVFRETDAPEYDPDFTVPLYPITPILGGLLSVALIGFMKEMEIALGLGFVVFAVIWYFAYARKHTELEGLLSEFIYERSEELPGEVVSAADAVQPDGGRHTVMVALSNPRTETALISLASAVAKSEGGSVLATHIVQVPDQTPLEAGSEHIDRIDAESKDVLAAAREDAETFDVDVETQTIVSHRSFEEIFDAARVHGVDTVVMGWGGSSLGQGRIERPLEELTHDLPCDFLVLDGDEIDPGRILVPTAGGDDSDVSATVARALRSEFGGEITLLHVVDDPDDRSAGEQFIREWADDHGLADASVIVDDSGDVEAAIERAAADHSMVVVGATGRGLLSRLVRGSLVFDVIETLEKPVVLAEKGTTRSLRERLLGGRDE